MTKISFNISDNNLKKLDEIQEWYINDLSKTCPGFELKVTRSDIIQIAISNFYDVVFPTNCM